MQRFIVSFLPFTAFASLDKINTVYQEVEGLLNLGSSSRSLTSLGSVSNLNQYRLNWTKSVLLKNQPFLFSFCFQLFFLWMLVLQRSVGILKSIKLQKPKKLKLFGLPTRCISLPKLTPKEKEFQPIVTIGNAKNTIKASNVLWWRIQLVSPILKLTLNQLT